MSTKRIILISGYARSGKDTLANALTKELAHLEPVRVKFADPLKRAVQLVLKELGLGHIDAFTEDEELKKILRPLMVEVGKCARAIDKDVFVKAAWRDIKDLFANGKNVAIVPDLRYFNEIELFKEWSDRNGWRLNHLRICRVGNGAANEEELHSICSLPQADAYRIFAEGDFNGIETWANELCRNPAMPVPDWLKAGNTGCPADPVKVAAYAMFNAGTKAWLERKPVDLAVPKIEACQESWSENWERRLKDLEAARIWASGDDAHKAHIQPPKPGVDLDDILKRIEYLEDNGRSAHQRIDGLHLEIRGLEDAGQKLSQRVDNNFSGTCTNQDSILGIRLALERIDARLKRLEVARG